MDFKSLLLWGYSANTACLLLSLGVWSKQMGSEGWLSPATAAACAGL